MEPTLEAYQELQQAYDFYNTRLFGGKLPTCLITFQREKRTMGYFSKARFIHRGSRSQTDEIALNPEYFAVIPLVEILQTLCHEMAHLWQAHFGTPSRACYHNTEWANKMEEIGLMPSETGQPGGRRTGQKMGDYVIAGGRFAQHTQDLLRTGFAVSWLDRFPARVDTLTTAIPAWAAAGPGQSTHMSAITIADDDDVGLTAASPSTEDTGSLAAAYTPPAALVPESLIIQDDRKNRSNRSKYDCAICCSVSVWGRPGLRVKCADCDTLLTETA